MFSLSKDDILSAVRDFPEAERILIEYGKRRLNKNQIKIEKSPTVNEIKSTGETTANSHIRKETIKEATIHEEEPKLNRTQSKKLKDISKLKELNTISEEINQRAAGNLTTDMLGIPTTNSSSLKYQNSEEVLADYFASANLASSTFYKNQLQKILNKLYAFFIDNMKKNRYTFINYVFLKLIEIALQRKLVLNPFEKI